MIEAAANWILNTFIRLSPEIMAIVFPIVLVIMLIALAKGIKQTSVNDSAKLKNVAFGPFIMFATCFIYLSLVTFLG